jgi:hypothetical protein
MSGFAFWYILKEDPLTVLLVGGIALFVSLVLTFAVADHAGDGLFGRAVRALRDLLGRVVIAVLVLMGASICVASVVFLFLLITRGPERAFGLHDELKGFLVPLGILFGAPPAVVAGVLCSELLARRRRRVMARMFAEASVATHLSVADIDYPLLPFARASNGLEFMPEPLRRAPLFADFPGRVEAAMTGSLAGVDVVIVDYWFTTVVTGRRYASSTKHRLTVVAARLPTTIEDPTSRGGEGRADRLQKAFGEGWSDLGDIDRWSRRADSRFYNWDASRRVPEGLAISAPRSPRIGEWLAFGSEAAISDVDELRGVLGAFTAVLGPQPRF